MKTFIRLTLILLIFLNWGQKGYSQVEETTISSAEIYSDTQKSVSISPIYMGEKEGRLIFSFKTKYLTSARRAAVKNATRLATTPYAESCTVIYDSTWTQFKVLSLTFYNEAGDVIDSLDLSRHTKWEDVDIDSEEELVKLQYAYKFASAIGRE